MMGPLENRLASEFRARGFSLLAEDVWCRRVDIDVSFILYLYSKSSKARFRVEVGLGIRFDRVEAAFFDAMGVEEESPVNSTLGCNLKDLAAGGNSAGWEYQTKSEFLEKGIEQMLECLDKKGIPALLEYSNIEALRNLIDARLKGGKKDNFIFREHHYIPLVFFLNGDFSRASKYLKEKLEEYEKGTPLGSPFLNSYRKFSQELLRAMAH